MSPAQTAIDPATLTRQGGVLLVSCYELGHQPLNLASPLAHLRAAGFHPATIDASVESLDEDAISQASLVAISTPMHTALRLGAEVARRVRQINPGAHICFYGLYATLNASHLLGGLGDSTIGGEYETALRQLAEALARGGDPAGVPGVGTKLRPAAPILDRIDSAAPERAPLPELRQYAGLETDGAIVRAGYIEATRGCHHTCGHCPITPIYGGRFFANPRGTVVADGRAQVLAGARHLTFGDPDFFNGPQHGLRIMRALRNEFPALTFDATIKIEHLLQHRKLLPELAALGCVFVVSAVETLSPTVLRKLAKGHSRADVETALVLLDDVGIPMRPSLLPFTPWATLDDYVELLAFVAENDLIHCVDPVHFSIRLLVPPGSALLDDPTSAEWRGGLDAALFTHRWRSPDPRLDDLQRRVAGLVEAAAAVGEDAETTFAAIWDLAAISSGRPGARPPEPKLRRARPPRLTESWFC